MINKIILVGRLTSDPQLKTTQSDATVANFTLAVNRPFLNNQGEKETDFIPVVVWRKQAENAAKYLKKGSLAGVDGRIQTRNYDGQDGRKIYVTEVVAENVQYLDTKNNNQQTTSNFESNQNNNNQKTNIEENDLPF